MKSSIFSHRDWVKTHRLRRIEKTRWPEICQLILSVLSLVGVVFLVVQMDQVERAIKGETYSKIYDQEFTLF